MLKSGQFALVTNDCAVRKGETVEVVKYRPPTVYGWTGTLMCWYNNVKVDIEESNLTPIKAERWKPEYNEKYWYIRSDGSVEWDKWEVHPTENKRWNSYNVFRTEEEAKAEAEATLADRKARLDK